MKLFQWLKNKGEEIIPKNISIDNTTLVENSLSKKMSEIEKTKETEKFIDVETGKEYKTARGLKSAITRRLNKAKKQSEVS